MGKVLIGGGGADITEGDWCVAAGYGLVDHSDLVALSKVFKHLRELGCVVAFDPSPWFAGRCVEEGRVAQQGRRGKWEDSQHLYARIALL
jgi:hypothetical protein